MHRLLQAIIPIFLLSLTFAGCSSDDEKGVEPIEEEPVDTLWTHFSFETDTITFESKGGSVLREIGFNWRLSIVYAVNGGERQNIVPTLSLKAVDDNGGYKDVEIFALYDSYGPQRFQRIEGEWFALSYPNADETKLSLEVSENKGNERILDILISFEDNSDTHHQRTLTIIQSAKSGN